MVKRFDENLESIVYKYDLFPPSDWGKDCEDELRRQNMLWNELCRIEREHIAAVRAVANPAVADLEQEINALVERYEALSKERLAARKAARKKVSTPELDAAIKPLTEEIKARRKVVKELRKTAYTDNKDKLKELDKARLERVKRARQDSGLFWCNYNAVIASYERARSRTVKSGHELHERPFTGEGRFVNQIQGGMTVGRLMAGTHSQAGVADKPIWMRKKTGATFKITAFTQPQDDGPRLRRTLSFPIILYRELPGDALIKEITVNRRPFAGGKFTWSVSILLTRSKQAAEPQEGSPVAINHGWRLIDEQDGTRSLRVATAVRWAEDGSFDEPTYTTMAGKLLAGFEEYERIQSERDNAKNNLVHVLRQRAPMANYIQTLPEPLRDFFANLLENKIVKRGFLIALYHRWRETSPSWEPDLYLKLSKWYTGEGRKSAPEWQQKIYEAAERVRMFGERGISLEQAHRRQWLTNARLYFYRMEARRLIGNASVVILNEHNMSDTARKNSNLPPPARRNRFMAAPSILRQTILNYCRKHDIEVRTFKSEGPSHWRCGLGLEYSFPDELRQLCPQCVEYFDTDVNLCQIMLRRTAQPTVPARKAA